MELGKDTPESVFSGSSAEFSIFSLVIMAFHSLDVAFVPFVCL